MAIYAVHLNVLTYIEADSDCDAEGKIYENPLAYYIDGDNVISDVEIHGIDFIVGDCDAE